MLRFIHAELNSEKSKLRSHNMNDSTKLFNAAWRQILVLKQNCGVDDLQATYEEVVTNKVNDPRSIFYIYG